MKRIILSDRDLVNGFLDLYATAHDEGGLAPDILKKYAIQVYQGELRQLLIYLLQNRDSFLPWRKPVSISRDRVRNLVKLAGCIDESVNTEHLLSSIAARYSAGDSPYRQLSVFVSEGYSLLESSFLPSVAHETHHNEVKISPINRNDYNEAFLHPVLKLHDFAQSEMQPFLKGLLLLGSLATLDYEPGFSDLDVLLIVNNPTLFNPDALLTLREKVQRSLGYLYSIDDLQHHGYIMTTEIDLKYYSPTVMPLEALSYSQSLLGDAVGIKLGVETRDAEMDRKRDFWRQYLNVRRMHEGDSSITTLYDMKYFLSLLLMLPTLYLQLLGIHCYKKHSFEKARPDFPPEVWQIVEKASAIRKEWYRNEGCPPRWYRTVLATARFYPPLLGLARYYYLKTKVQVPRWIISELGGNYIADANALAEAMVQQAKQVGKL